MNPIPQHASGGVPKLLAQARDSAERNDYAQAIQLLQRAKGLEPRNDKVFLELGRVYAITYDFASAHCAFENALAVTESRVMVLLTIGHHWMDVRNFEAATGYFEQVLKCEPVPVTAYLRLFEMYHRLRRTDDAGAIIERALHAYPSHEGVRLMHGKWLRQCRKYHEAEITLLELVSNTSLSPDVRAAAGYELAAVLDAEGCYDEAFEAAIEAKALLRSGAAPAMKTYREKQTRLRQLSTTIDAKVIERWRATGRTDLQPARKLSLLCGYPRSGTTLLEYVLDAHPDVVSADETGVFQTKAYPELSRNLSDRTPYVAAIDSITPRNLRRIRTEYFDGIESHLGSRVGERMLVDKNPGMTFDVPLMSRVFPDCKFLVALRDPRDVCISCFMQAWPVLPDTISWLSAEGTVENYVATMGLWLVMKPALGNSAIEVRYEDIVHKLQENARRALSFLGLPWDDRVLRFTENAQAKVVRSPTYVEVAKPVYTNAIGRWRNYQKHFEPHFEKLTPLLKAFGYLLIILSCYIKHAAMVMMFWLLVALSLGKASAEEVDRKPPMRRSSHLARTSVIRGGNVRLARRALEAAPAK